MISERLRRLDDKIADRPWSTKWLLALSAIGFVLLVVAAFGLAYGNGLGGGFSVIGAMFLVPLAEIWQRRQAARGKQAFAWFRRLDDRVYSSRVGRRVPGFRKWWALTAQQRKAPL